MRFETLYSELACSTDMIRALLTGIEPEQAKARPDEQSWSVLEVICHLHDEEREDFREHLDFILNRQHEEWHTIDPQSWVAERKYNERAFDEMSAKFFSERAHSLEWLKTMQDRDWDTRYASQYGELSAGELLASWVAHDNLHIRQLVELRRSRIERITQPYSIEYAGDW